MVRQKQTKEESEKRQTFFPPGTIDRLLIVLCSLVEDPIVEADVDAEAGDEGDKNDDGIGNDSFLFGTIIVPIQSIGVSKHGEKEI